MEFLAYLDTQTLREVFDTKLKYRQTIGSDGITTRKFEEILDEEIEIIQRKTANLTYKVSPYVEKLILKGSDSYPRKISIPTNRDKLTFSALTAFITDIFKDILTSSSIHTKILDIKEKIRSNLYDTFIKIDIKNYYPSIDHEILFQKIKKHIDDEHALYVLEKALTTPTIPKGRLKKRPAPNQKGIPQGLSMSNILSSIYLSDLDEKYLQRSSFSYYRFVDDILILCNKEDAVKIQEEIEEDMSSLQLHMHESKSGSDKSSMGTINEEPFQFLGYHFFDGKVSVRESSVDKIRERIALLFAKERDSVDFIERLNLKITGCTYDDKQYGWMRYFGLIDDMTLLHSLDAFVKNSFKRYDMPYDTDEVKKFTKTYFKQKNEKTTYIPKFMSKKFQQKLKLQKEIEELSKDVIFY